MCTLEDMYPDLHTLGAALDKYARIAKLPVDFGTGMPLYPAEIHTLGTICAHGPLSVSQLARKAGVTKGAVSQLVSRLEAKGLVSKEPDQDNRSRVLLSPTALGRKAEQGHMAFHKEHDKEFFTWLGGLPDAQYKVFKELCSRMDKWMDKHLC